MSAADTPLHGSGTEPGGLARAGDGLFGVTGVLDTLSADQIARLFDRGRATDPAVEQAVRELIADVRARGDDALRELALRFDGVRLDSLEVPRSACDRALGALEPGVRAALEQAAHNIATFHRAQLPAPLEIEPAPGLRLGRRADPLRRVGVYAPGGRAAYPSSVLMGVVPARVAAVDEILVCSPPGHDGLPSPAVLAACALCGADRVFALGGAGAVAALALGTTSVPRVDKIVGPGNAYVAEAKRQLTGTVAIDSPAGPSEVLILADGTADATLLAAELLAQAEHDPDAAAVLVTTSREQCGAVADEVARLLAAQPRADIIRAALAARGALLFTHDIEIAIRFAEQYAPEHLLVMTRDPRSVLPRLRAAGTIFLGAPSSVAFGDYLTGANHVLPTAGHARAFAGLSTLDFVRWTTYQELSSGAAAALVEPTVVLAEAEGLPAHALAARLRAAPDDRAGTGAPRAAAWHGPVRDAYRGLQPYDPGRLPSATDLSDNTNLFGPPPSAARALRGLDAGRMTRYPTVYGTDLKVMVAKLLGVEPANIATGCGSDDLIDSAVRAFCDPGDLVAYPEPTFGMVPVFTRMNAARPVAVPLRADFELDAAALLRPRPRLTYLCRPNNPTGTAFERAATLHVCNAAAGVVLVDEAYADFADDDVIQPVLESGRAVVLRTFSKAYGLAGLRAGIAIGAAELIAEIEKSRGPYKLSGVAEAAVVAVLSRDLTWVRERVAEVRESRARLRQELTARSVRTWPSAANFVLAAVPGGAADWNLRLRARGVAIRPFAALGEAGDCVRITIGPWPMMERFLTAFDQVMDGMQT
jgi:histidinol dehydrogenase